MHSLMCTLIILFGNVYATFVCFTESFGQNYPEVCTPGVHYVLINEITRDFNALSLVINLIRSSTEHWTVYPLL